MRYAFDITRYFVMRNKNYTKETKEKSILRLSYINGIIPHCEKNNDRKFL